MDEQLPRIGAECPPVPPEQGAYARVLEVGLLLTAIVLVVTFVVYATGLRPSYVPIENLERYWTMPARQYVQQADAPRGWGWTRYVAYADFAMYVGIAMLATLSAVAYLRVVPMLAQRRMIGLMVIALAQIAVIALAALSGV